MRRRRGEAPPWDVDAPAEVRAPALSTAAGLLRAGAPPATAWAAAGLGAPGPDGVPGGASLELAAAAVLAHTAGCPLAPTVEALAERLADAEDAAARAEAGAAGARLSARILGFLPVVGVAFAAIIDPGAVVWLIRNALGLSCLVAGVLLTLIGRRWLNRMVRRATAPPSREEAAVPFALMLTEVAVGAGVDVRGALAGVGEALAEMAPGSAAALRDVADRLADGERWDLAWEGASGRLDPLCEALRWCWIAGGAPGPALRSARLSLERAEASSREARVAELEVRVALPLSLCLLPAFVLLGVVPMLAAVAAGAGLG
ncbi:type II secretion system F family protein [Demequina sp. NBRC 110054]|uniref:type II secretion system F family protein n=1 Tax=Demequina sp. NBRC 110054 TaxID=1570343 RepID=UPI000A01E24E|nr:type II secretion system F family protein [Demequina sp. NBRC 110054]